MINPHSKLIFTSASALENLLKSHPALLQHGDLATLSTKLAAIPVPGCGGCSGKAIAAQKNKDKIATEFLQSMPQSTADYIKQVVKVGRVCYYETKNGAMTRKCM